MNTLMQDRVLPSVVETVSDRRGRVREVEWLLARLREAWGNGKWSARVDYLYACLALALRGSGPILECGSGLTTLVLGVASRHSGRPVISLEHDAGWARATKESLCQHELAQVAVRHAPLKDYGGFQWYDISGLDLPGDFSLVVCDGPPGSTPGGRYGLMPVMHDFLSSDCLILLDDTERPGEQEVLARWQREFGTRVESCAPDGHFCRLVRTPGAMEAGAAV